jgi:hypothetical protein
MQAKLRSFLTVATLMCVLLSQWGIVAKPARAAGPWYVAPGGSDGDPCDLADPCATVNGAIGKATAGDTILVASGVYTGAGAEVILLDKSLALSGGWNIGFSQQAGLTTVDGENTRRGLTVPSGVQASVDGFDFVGGYAEQGGGLRNDGALAVTSSRVADNASDNGISNSGAGLFNSGMLTLTDVLIVDNTMLALPGAGIYNVGTLRLVDSHVSRNGLGVGGGGIINSGLLTVTGSLIDQNEFYGIYNFASLALTGSSVSRNGGSGLVTYFGPLTITTSVIDRNFLGIDIFGGAIANLVNSTVSSNLGQGGIRVYGGGTLYLSSSSIINNASPGLDGSANGSVTMKNSLVAGSRPNPGNSAADCYGSLTSAGYNLIGTMSGCSLTGGVGDLLNVNPQVGALINDPGYHPLLAGSPAISAGNPAGCTDHFGNPLPTDQRGVARVGRCDIGAYEYTVPGPAAQVVAVAGTPQNAPPLLAYLVPMQALVMDSQGSPVAGAMVLFSAPGTGASGVFASSGTAALSVPADSSGLALASAFTANAVSGSYLVTATFSGVPQPAQFVLTNSGWYVSPDGEDANSCDQPAAPCLTIGGALDKAADTAGSTVLVAAGTYTETTYPTIFLSSARHLLGGWNSDFTAQTGLATVDGEDTRQGLSVRTGATALVDRFVFEHGFGISGGGVQNFGTLVITHSTVRHNMAPGGFGCSDGGGIYNTGSLELSASTVHANQASGSGGGIFNSGTMWITNTTISANSTSCGSGGGIGNTGALTITASTIVSNTSNGGIGGLNTNGGRHLTLLNSIVAGNTTTGGQPSDCSLGLTVVKYSLIQTGCFSFGVDTSTLLLGLSPKIEPLADNGGPNWTHALQAGSPAIDGGNPATPGSGGQACPAVDQRGLARPNGFYCDLGAYESAFAATHVGFSQAIFSAAENGGPATITVTLSAPLTQTVTVHYATANQSAIAGADYVAASGTLTFTPGISTQTFQVVLLTDFVSEFDEALLLELSDVVGAVPGPNFTANLVIQNALYRVYVPLTRK